MGDFAFTRRGFSTEFVADPVNPAKARMTPTEQRTKPIETRGPNTADREVEFVFIEVVFFLFS